MKNHEIMTLESRFKKYLRKDLIKSYVYSKENNLIINLFQKKVTDLRNEYCDLSKSTIKIKNLNNAKSNQINTIKEEIENIKNPKLTEPKRHNSDDTIKTKKLFQEKKLNSLQEELQICNSHINELNIEIGNYKNINNKIEDENNKCNIELNNKLSYIIYLEMKLNRYKNNSLK